MDARLRKIVDSVLDEYQANPNTDVDTGTLLQIRLVQAGLQHDFSEDDIIKAAEEVGVPEEDLGSWLEQLASWL